MRRLSGRMTHGFKSLTPLAEARAALVDRIDPIDRVETVALDAADDRVAAAPVEAPVDLPGQDRAAMDGYAVRARDTHGASDRAPLVLDLGEKAGPGSAVRVHTGSPMPDGADAVVMLEEADATGEELTVFTAVHRGRHVADRGEDVEAGDVVVEPGHRLGPSDLGLLKALEVGGVDVVDRPDVAVVATGDEVVAADPGPGETVESNGIVVQALLSRWGARSRHRGIVPDVPDRLADAVRPGDRDLLLTIGGTSVGRRDHLPDVLDRAGERLFHGVAVRPGHPVGAWIVDGTPVVTLPGYPVACLVTATLLVRPAVRRLGRRPAVPDPVVEAPLARKVPSRIGDLHVVRVRLKGGEGDRVAEPTRSKGAGVISSVTTADGVVLVEPRSEGLDAGETVEVVIWE